MKNHLCLIICFIGLISCTSRQTIAPKQNSDTSSVLKEDNDNSSKITTDKPIMVGRAYIGMTIDELKKEYQTAELKSESVNNYDIDGPGDGILVIENKKKQFFVWTMEGENTITGIEILSPDLNIDNGVHVGMTFQEFQQIRPNSTLAISEINTPYEFCYVSELKYTVDFYTVDSNRVGNYKETEAGSEFIDLARPQTKVDRVSLR